MKKSLFALCIALAGIILVFPSCEESEGFHQISQIEREIYLKINSYRNSQGESSLVEQFLLFKEGRVVSEKLAAGTYNLNDPQAQNDIDEITSNLGGTSNALLTLTINIENADSVVNALTRNTSSAEILLEQFTQCGVGFSTDGDQLNYVAIMLIDIPD